MRLNRTAAVLCAILAGCGDRDAPKIPLGDAGSTAPTITGEARVALDSGNALFRAKSYDAALGQYERSARLIPDQVAPLLGILMVADVKQDQSLAKATLERVRKLDPALADSGAVSSHSRILERHPPADAAAKLPPSHPPIGGDSRRQ